MNGIKRAGVPMRTAVSKRTLIRLPLYLSYLKSLYDRPEMVSAAGIAKALRLNSVLVRKDLACVVAGGRPRTGYITRELMDDIERFMGYKELQKAVIVGTGKLSAALLEYDGFTEYGLEMVAAFGSGGSDWRNINDKPVFPLKKLREICCIEKAYIGVVAVPAEEAQKAADCLVDCGIRAIWNLTPVHLNVPDSVLVGNENIGASLALLSGRLFKKFSPDENKHAAEA